jgi:hypothetical protein
MAVDQAGQQSMVRQMYNGWALGRGIADTGHLDDAIGLDDNGALGQRLSGHHIKQRPRADDHALRSSHAAV